MQGEIDEKEQLIEKYLVEQAAATELEDYDKAASIDDHITETRNSISTKKREMKQLAEQSDNLELMKGDKITQMAHLMRRCMSQFATIRESTEAQQEQFEEE